MHRLDPTTTVLTAVLALMTAFALATETPFTVAGGRVTNPAPSAVEIPARVRPTPGTSGWVALHAAAVTTLPPRVVRGR